MWGREDGDQDEGSSPPRERRRSARGGVSSLRAAAGGVGVWGGSAVGASRCLRVPWLSSSLPLSVWNLPAACQVLPCGARVLAPVTPLSASVSCSASLPTPPAKKHPRSVFPGEAMRGGRDLQSRPGRALGGRPPPGLPAPASPMSRCVHRPSSAPHVPGPLTPRSASERLWDFRLLLR